MISFGGLGNGIDFGPIVDFLVQAKRIPIDRITERKLNDQEKLTNFGSLGTKLLGLQNAANSLRTRLSFDKNEVGVSSASSQTLLTGLVCCRLRTVVRPTSGIFWADFGS